MRVYVVTNVEMGWDCVVGVYTVENLEEYEQLQREYNYDKETSSYVITEQTVQKFDLADMD
jgi:hypothetical protein